jgi:hypothetical protein
LGKTHELVGLLYDDNTVAVVAQPDGSMGTRRTAADDDDIPRDGLGAVTALECGSSGSCCGEVAKAHSGTHGVTHLDPTASKKCHEEELQQCGCA